MTDFKTAEEALNHHNKRMSEIPSYDRPSSIPEGLKFLANWFDAMYPGDPDTAVQEDLRRWADSMDSITEMAETILKELKEAK
jgi:hypothetical protein